MGLGQLLAGGALEPGEAVHGHHLDLLPPGLVPGGEPGLEDLLGPARGHARQTCRTSPVAHRRQVDDHRDVLIAPLGAAPHMLIDTEDLHPAEAVRVLGENLLGPGQDRGVGGVPSHPQRLRGPGDRHGLKAEGPQPPLHRRAGQTGSGPGQSRGVLPPYPAAVPAGEAPHTHHQLGGSPGHRHVRQAPGHRPPSRPLRPAHLAQGILQADGHAALDHRPLRRQEPAHRGQSQGLQAQEGRQVGAGEGSLRHVEVSVMACAAAPIIGGPRPPPAQRRTPNPA